MTTLATLTPEHLGSDATAEDVAEFTGYVEELLARRPELAEEDAIGLVWNDGDYLAAARRLALDVRTYAGPNGERYTIPE